ncbi:hypothetical protein OE88DRAFT_634153 [Heliocybe sulcata]|uniref:Uncharacterized protein n=1 Tax=Heliocybe sulcata TaxID=5364 RepID=A0A5C3NCZ0_9AGAM|nr:hypothetical protein OE88DRAFT_634153 [Heliocybe sulcata]
MDVAEDESKGMHPNSPSSNVARNPGLFFSAGRGPVYLRVNPETYAPATLAHYGIKVRDFGYESTLPPLPSVRLPPRPPSQVDGGPRLLKRSRRDWDDETPFWGGPLNTYPNYSSHPQGPGSAKKPKPLERTPTEPVIDSEGSQEVQEGELRRPQRHGVIVDLFGYSSSQEPSSQSQDTEDYGLNGHVASQIPAMLPSLTVQKSPNREQIPTLSHEHTEAYVVTPIATPNGSLQSRNDELAAAPTLLPPIIAQDALTSEPAMSSHKDKQNGELCPPSSPVPSSSDVNAGGPSTTSPSARNPLASPRQAGTRGRTRTTPAHSSTAASGDAAPRRYSLRKRPDSRSPAPPAPTATPIRSRRLATTPPVPATAPSRSTRRATTPPRRKTPSRKTSAAPVPAKAEKAKDAPKTRRSSANRSVRL